MPPRTPELGAAELEVLKALWSHGPATVHEVRDLLRQHGRKVAYTTVLTFLSRLEQKGCVRSDKTGRAYVYRAVVTHDRVIGSRVKEAMKQLFDGAAAPMVLHLIENEKFSSKELADLQKLIDDLARQKEKRARKRR
jgi:BlaI family transcriptional regulator, penicillinase repressor